MLWIELSQKYDLWRNIVKVMISKVLYLTVICKKKKRKRKAIKESARTLQILICVYLIIFFSY